MKEIWGSSAMDVFAMGYDPGVPGYGGCIFHYDSSTWSTTKCYLAELAAVWGSSASDVYAIGQTASYHYDGTAWAVASAVPKGTAIWGSSATNVFVLDETAIQRYDGTSGKATVLPGGCPKLAGIHGASATEVFAVGEDETVMRYCPGGTCPP